MHPTIRLSLLAAACALSLSACSESGNRNSPLNLAPGTYKSETKSTNASGTDVKAERTTEVGYDAYGNKTAVTKTETTRDPKGLFNKSKTESTQVVKER